MNYILLILLILLCVILISIEKFTNRRLIKPKIKNRQKNNKINKPNYINYRELLDGNNIEIKGLRGFNINNKSNINTLYKDIHNNKCSKTDKYLCDKSLILNK